jgi:hypothetical protein
LEINERILSELLELNRSVSQIEERLRSGDEKLDKFEKSIQVFLPTSISVQNHLEKHKKNNQKIWVFLSSLAIYVFRTEFWKIIKWVKSIK